MKYFNPEMEIVEFDEKILTTVGLNSTNETDNENPTGGTDFPVIP